MMDSKKAMPFVALKLNEDDFKTSEFRTIYSVCLRLFKSNKPIDAVTILSSLGNEYKETIVATAQTVPLISHLSAYIDAVKGRSQKIDAYNKALAFIESIDRENPSIEQCRSNAAEVVNCFNENTQQEAVSAEQGYIDFVDRMEHPRAHIETGYELIDKCIYLDRGDFFVVGGRPSAGKTAFTLQMMLHMAEKHRVGYFSLETSKEKIFDRLVSNYAWTSFSKIKQCNLNDDDWQSITSRYDTFSKLGFEVVPAAGWTVEKIKSYAEIRQYEIVFIDYLTLIRAQGKDDTERATHISEELHTLAQQDGITIVALSQLNRGNGDELTLESLRQSGQIEQDADEVILIQYSADTPDVRDIKIAKNKEGKTGRIKAAFDGDHQRFSLMETRYGE